MALGGLFLLGAAVSGGAAVMLQWSLRQPPATHSPLEYLSTAVTAGLGVTTPLFALMLTWRKQQVDETEISILTGSKPPTPPPPTASSIEICDYVSRLMHTAEAQIFGWQQTIDTLCLYIHAAGQRVAGQTDPSSEMLTSTLQPLLVRHLKRAETTHRLGAWWYVWRRSGRAGIGGWWPGITVTLPGAVLVNFDFSWCHARAARFDRTRFVGRTRFVHASFERVVHLERSRFESDADFTAAVFRTAVHFDHAEFVASARFLELKGIATFHGARFHALVEFSNDCPDIDLSGAYLSPSAAGSMRLPQGWIVQPGSDWMPVVRAEPADANEGAN